MADPLDAILNKPSRARQAQLDAAAAKPQKRGLVERALDRVFLSHHNEPKDPAKKDKWEKKHILPKMTDAAKARHLKHKATGKGKRKEYRDTEYKGMGTYGSTGAEHGILGG